MKLLGAIFASFLSLFSCADTKAPAASGEKLIHFTIDTPLKQLTVEAGGSAYHLSYFDGGDPQPASVEALNIHLLAPPGRYLYDPKTRTFRRFLHYKGLETSSLLERRALAMRRHHQADNLIILTLPGTYGTSTNQLSLQDEPLVFEVVADALDQLKRRYKAKRINISAHSATAAVAAGLMIRRSDFKCVVLSSGVYDMPEIVRENGWPSTYAGAAKPYSVMDMARDFKPQSDRTVLLMGEREDQRVPFKQTERFYATLHAIDPTVKLEIRVTNDPEHHGLGRYAEERMLDCATGIKKTAF